MFDGQQVVASDPLRETHRPQIVAISPPDPAAGPTAFYGLGWFVSYDDRGRLVVMHGGDFNSYSTQATLLPAAGLGIVVLCNGGASAVREAIPKAFLEMVTQGEPSQDWVSAIETSSAAALASILATSTPFPQGEPPADAAPPLPLDAYTGTYTNTIYGEVTVREEAGGLVLEFGPNGVRHRLFPWNRDAFSMPLTGSRCGPDCPARRALHHRSGGSGGRGAGQPGGCRPRRGGDVHASHGRRLRPGVAPDDGRRFSAPTREGVPFLTRPRPGGRHARPAQAPPPRPADRRLAGGPRSRRTTSTAIWRRSST